jgi:hypothetical protein
VLDLSFFGFSKGWLKKTQGGLKTRNYFAMRKFLLAVRSLVVETIRSRKNKAGESASFVSSTSVEMKNV